MTRKGKTLKQILEQERNDGERVARLARARPDLPFNDTYRLAYRKSPARDDTRTLLTFAESVGALSGDCRRWYANGETCEDRPSVLATFHPLLYQPDGGWAQICETARALAKDLGRWIWVTRGEDHWVRILVGSDPRDDDDDRPTGPMFNAEGKYQNDQYITTFSPDGKEHFVGCS